MIINMPNVMGGNRYLVFVIWILLNPILTLAQNSDLIIKKLVEEGFENVGVDIKDSCSVYTLQSSRYLLLDESVRHAINVINKYGDTIKSNKIIVLNNSIPQLSVTSQPGLDTKKYSNWKVSTELEVTLKDIKAIKKENSSCFKADLVFYPEFMFRNYRLSVNYEYVANISPTLEISLLPGMKFVGQIVIPIHNDYGPNYESIRPGYLTLSQSIRLPYRSFATLYAGSFSNFRQGVALDLHHNLICENIWFKGRIAYTEKGIWDHFKLISGAKFVTTGFIQANWLWRKYNMQVSAQIERFPLKEYGITGDLLFHFRHTTIGVYVRKLHKEFYMAHNGFNSGFLFQAAMPPFKNKRKGHIPRVRVGDYTMRYNSSNEKNYGFNFKTHPDEGVYRDNYYNSQILQSYLNK